MASLSSEEREKLAAGIPDLRELSDHLLVPFEVRALTRARVLWLNERWFACRGLPVSEASIRARVEKWVLEDFAVSTGPARASSRGNSRTVHADRYGDPRGTSPHGGGGRVANIGRFQVKGVGPTPLVGDATWMHSHGCMSLTEAVAEAVYGELLDQELPFGTIPVIAMIDAGEDGRALIVRPAVFRPAHLLRAPLFVDSPEAALQPSRDAARTHDVVVHLADMSDEARTRLGIPSNIAELMGRYAAQAARGEALRLYTGGLFAQNVSMDGAILDFGVARTLYTWSNLQLHAHAQGFGRDLDRLVNTASAIQYFARKGGRRDAHWFASQIDAAALRVTSRSERRQMFGRIWSDDLLAPDVRERIRDETEHYYERQQRLTLRERWDGKRPDVDWIHDTLVAASEAVSSTLESDCVSRVRAAIREAGTGPRSLAHCWRSAARLLQPRPELDRARLERRVRRVFRESADARRVARLIDGALARCRRWWPDLPAELAVLTQRMRAGSAALEVLDVGSSEKFWWLEGVRFDDRLWWGSTNLSAAHIRQLRPRSYGAKWVARCRLDELPDSIATQLAVKPAVTYRDPPAWWT